MAHTGGIRVLISKQAPDVPLPEYHSPASSGMDLHAYLKEPLTVEPGRIALIPTGLRMAVPPGYEAQVRPRSGLALRHGLTVLNTPGTIDADYRGEIKVILANLSSEPFVVQEGMRIAQLVVAPVVHARLHVVDRLPETERSEGGFGHTGL